MSRRGSDASTSRPSRSNGNGSGSSTSTPMDDVQSLLSLAKSHQRSHDDGTSTNPASSAQRCRAMLNKLKKVLLKALRVILTVDDQMAVAMLRDMCELLHLLIHARVCPHAHIIFVDEKKHDAAESDVTTPGDLNIVTQPFVTIATILLYLVSFFCNERLVDAQDQVLEIIVQLVMLLQSRDAYASLHFFRDSVEFLEDCLLLEECMRKSPVDAGTASIACYLNTAIHTFHRSAGPLGSSSSKVLCGCLTIDDPVAVCQRQEQLKTMLPPILVATHSSAVVLRRSIENLVTELLRVNGSQVVHDHYCQRLRQLVEPLLDRDREIVGAIKNVSVVSGDSKKDKLDAAEATCNLIAVILSYSNSEPERLVVQIVQAFFKHTTCYAHVDELVDTVGVILRQISECVGRFSSIGRADLWTSIMQWHSEVHASASELSENWTLLMVPLLQLYNVLVEESQGASVVAALELLDLRGAFSQNEDAHILIVKSIHKFVSTRQQLTSLLHMCSKNLINRQQSGGVPKRRETRKRRREDTIRGGSRLDVPHVREVCCEFLSGYIIDLVFNHDPEPGNDTQSMVLALRILMPLRSLSERIARVDTQSIIRTIIQRVEEVFRTSELRDASIKSASLVELVIVLLAHLREEEVGRFRILVDGIVSTLSLSTDLQDHSSLQDGVNLEVLEMARGVHALREIPAGWSSTDLTRWLDACSSFINQVFRMPSYLKRFFVAIVVWKHHRVFNLRIGKFHETVPGNAIASICSRSETGVGNLAYLSTLPLILAFIDKEQSDAESRDLLVKCIIEILFAPCLSLSSDGIRVTDVCLNAIRTVVCLSATSGILHKEFVEWAMTQGSCCPSQAECSRISVSLAAVSESLHHITEWFQVPDKLNRHRKPMLRLAVCLLHHIKFQNSTVIERTLVMELVRATTDQDRLARRDAMRYMRMCTHLPVFIKHVIGKEESTSIGTGMEALSNAIDKAIKARDYLLLESCIEAIGAICESKSAASEDHRQVLVWGLLRLLFLWIDNHRTQIPVATALHDQMRRIFTRHNLSWKSLFLSHPEDIYFPVIDYLLRSRSVSAFSRTFYGAYFDQTTIIRESTRYVLPIYVVQCQDDMMRCFLDAYNGELSDNDVNMDDDTTDHYASTATTMSMLLHRNIEHVLKELLIHQVEVDNNENRTKQWNFLLNYFPENILMRDLISHVPLRLLNLLAWELGGERSGLAKRAFREISQYLSQGKDVSDGDVDAALVMPRQYFLGLVTDLGYRMEKKSGSTDILCRVRAIRSIHRLFGMFNQQDDDTSDVVKGALDPFVPKVMAILKVGLYDKQLQEHTISAWSAFIRMLTPKALESNFVSIVVSLLPCIPNRTISLQKDSGQYQQGVWCLEMIEVLDSSEATTNSQRTCEESVSSATIFAAVGILKYLFVDMRSELKHVFPLVRLIPTIPELDEVHAVYISEVGDPNTRPLSEFLTSCLSYVTHWDSGVRAVVLRELHHALVTRATELNQLMESEGDIVDPAVLEILFAVLQVAKTDASEGIRLLCAKCLGSLGAVDGARIPLNILHSSKASVTTAKERSDLRLEYSTKDLACVLIENWLVKELRAAPESTDRVAFSIQELLKFLADLSADPQHSGQGLDRGAGRKAKVHKNTSMPEWLKRRFERKDVLEFVEPYWYTDYTLKTASTTKKNIVTELSTTFYEKYSSSYEEWLQGWCERLIDLSQPPERKIFQACETVLSTSSQIGRFLLPYLIQNVLRSGRPEVYEEVKKEMMAVLKDDGVMDDVVKSSSVGIARASVDRLDDANERAFGEYASRHHQCAQAIVSTIDELNEWVWSNEKKRLALSAPASRSATPTPGRSGDVPLDLDDQEKENLEEFLKDIPSQVLSSAAFKIKAYARALQYFEVYLRQQQPPEKSESNNTSTLLSTLPVDLALVSKHATYLQQLYSRVDEPDALTGLATLRRLYDAQRLSEPPTERAGTEAEEPNASLTYLLHQVVDHEQLAQWEDALACYEQAIQEVHSAEANHDFFSVDAMETDEDAQQGQTMNLNSISDPRSVKPALYSGIVQCLIQLGRLESALQHINGIVTQEPQFVGTLYPHALECAWRLSRWELVSELLNTEQQTSLLSNSLVQGGVSSRLRNLDVSQLSLVRVLHSFHEGKPAAILKNLQEARLEIMGPLAAACAESYQRAYPLLHKLHFLHEAEMGFICLHTSRELSSELREKRWQDQCPWGSRYDLLSASLKFRDPILALRRVMLQEAELRTEVSHNWLSYAKVARKEGYIRTATSAVMHAEALDNPYASLEKAKLMVAQEKMYEALQILEPVDIDASKLEYKVEDPHYCAKNLLLATNWMQESGQRQGRKVVERYEAVITFDPKWEKGYFFLAKYFEYLLSVSHPEAPTTMASASNSRNEDATVNIDSTFHSHLINLMKNYVLALTHGTKHVFQSMPRLLTLWFEYGELLHAGSNKVASVNKAMRSIEMELSQPSAESKILTEISQTMQNAMDTLPAYEWLVCFPQVTSRICHPNPIVVDGVKKIMLKVLVTYPTQAMWPLLGLSRSLNSQRRNRAREIISATQRHFVTEGLQEVANSFGEGMRLAEELISLAGHDPANQRKIHIKMSRIRTLILVPVQAALNTVLPLSGLAPSDDRHAAFMPHSQIHIKSFSDKADVMMTKEKPKRIEILGSDGKLYPFLCKREKTGDLRKDARMMEFNTMINKLLQKNREGRKRKLRLRTYAVVCLNEESGLMEWVRHTKAMRQLIGQIHKTERGFIQPVRLTHEIKERFLGMQKKFASNTTMMALYFRHKILSLPVFTPRFHQWFTNNFADPTAWYEARLAFSRSAAVWSMVGHIIGLGDRHGENILIDCTNGECVHVDFDCLFDKGLKLAKPEIVPFRLTPNIIDAFGITGYEGVFRRVCEVTMTLLRENRETLRSVLESFIHDPLVEWGRRGKNAQGMASSATGRSIADIPSDRSKEETRIILKTIDDRLSGIYNLGDAIRPLVSSAHRSLLPENETLPLSVQGQVDKLIHEATAHENLAQMYIGWMPFL